MTGCLILTGGRFQKRGIERYIYNIVKSEIKGNISFTVFSALGYDPEEAKKLREIGVRVIDREFTDDIFRNIKSAISYISFLKKLTGTGDYRIVYINGGRIRFDFLALLGTQHKQVYKTIIHIHNPIYFKDRYQIVKRLCILFHKFLARKLADVYLACSNDAAVVSFGKKILQSPNYHFIPNTIDVEKFKFNGQFRTEICNDLRLSKSTFLLGSVGALVYQKNLEFIVRRLDEIPDKYDIIYLIIGAGSNLEKSEEESLRSAAKSSKKRIIFTGSTPDVYKYLCAMDLFVMPSRFEGLGIAALEAQASGLPCLLSSAIPRIVKVTDRVEFIPLDDPAKWTDAIIEKYEDWKKNGNDEAQRLADSVTMEKSQFSNEHLPEIVKELFG